MVVRYKRNEITATLVIVCVFVFGIVCLQQFSHTTNDQIFFNLASGRSFTVQSQHKNALNKVVTWQRDFTYRSQFTTAIKYQKLLTVEKRKTTAASSFKEKESKRVETLPHVFTYRNNSWQIADICKPYTVYLNRTDFPLVKFSSLAGVTKIFTHSIAIDGISSLIKRYGAFEVETINRIVYELQKDNQLNLIDIGTNVGQHSIAAALIGREALAIDCAKSNIEHVCATVQYSNFSDKITMVYNIISDTHEKRQVRYSPNNDHFGNTYVESDGIGAKMLSSFKKGFFSNKTVEEDAVSLDDMLRLPQMDRFKKVFIKLDVEGHEHRVLQGGMQFFKTVHISGIIMEWAWHKNRKTANLIISLMQTFKFKPYEIPRSKPQNQIDISDRDPNKWPQDVLWLPVK